MAYGGAHGRRRAAIGRQGCGRSARALDRPVREGEGEGGDGDVAGQSPRAEARPAAYQQPVRLRGGGEQVRDLRGEHAQQHDLREDVLEARVAEHGDQRGQHGRHDDAEDRNAALPAQLREEGGEQAVAGGGVRHFGAQHRPAVEGADARHDGGDGVPGPGAAEDVVRGVRERGGRGAHHAGPEGPGPQGPFSPGSSASTDEPVFRGPPPVPNGPCDGPGDPCSAAALRNTLVREVRTPGSGGTS